jgi:hypothetical protein
MVIRQVTTPQVCICLPGFTHHLIWWWSVQGPSASSDIGQGCDWPFKMSGHMHGVNRRRLPRGESLPPSRRPGPLPQLGGLFPVWWSRCRFLTRCTENRPAGRTTKRPGTRMTELSRCQSHSTVSHVVYVGTWTRIGQKLPREPGKERPVDS